MTSYQLARKCFSQQTLGVQSFLRECLEPLLSSRAQRPDKNKDIKGTCQQRGKWCLVPNLKRKGIPLPTRGS